MTSKDTPDGERLSLADFDMANYVEVPDEAQRKRGALTRLAKESVVTEKIRHALFLHGRDGLTAHEVAAIAGLSEPTARKHLEKLCSIREAYAVIRQANMRLYYPNGEPLHGLGKDRIEDGPHILEAVLARGPQNRLFIHITEKRFSALEGERTEGGVLVPLDIVTQFVDVIKKLKTKGDTIAER